MEKSEVETLRLRGDALQRELESARAEGAAALEREIAARRGVEGERDALAAELEAVCAANDELQDELRELRERKAAGGDA
jgi:septation ring formation regulator EzrA